MTDPATRRAGLRLRRTRPAERFLPVAPEPGPPPRAWLFAAIWLGLFTGIAEVALVLALKSYRDGSPAFFHMNRHLVWMIPLFHAAAFLVSGSLLFGLARARPRFSTRRAAIFLGTQSLLSLTLAVKSIHPAAGAMFAFGIAYRLAPWVERSFGGRVRWVRATLPCLAAIVLGMFALSLGREVVGERAAMARLDQRHRAGPNVLLIVLDTVGAGHLSLHGYHRDTSPHLARLARRGVRFDNARSTAPWTLPSHASMFTGRWPHELSADFDGPLDTSVPTLAEYLRERGYATAGLIANSLYCSAETGLNRGFIHYEDHELDASAVVHSAALGQRVLEKAAAALARPASAPTRSPVRPYKDAARINRDALAWLAEQGGRPFFLFLNYFDAHTPYLLPDGCDRHFGLAPKAKADFNALNGFWTADKQSLSPRDVTLARDAYDDCIASLDEQVGRLIDELERRGLMEDTLVIITADHGEQLGEHGLYGHAGSLYRPEVHVPLVIVPPRGMPRGHAVAEPVSLRNLPATVVDLAGGGGPSPFPGSSLARHWDPARAVERPAEEPVLSEVEAPAPNNPNHGRSPVFRGTMASLVAEGKVYIRNGNGDEELYDLATDPAESLNLAGTAGSQKLLARMRAALGLVRNKPLTERKSAPRR